jgi:hypothetical protein
MVLVYFTGGHCIGVAAAVTAEVREAMVVCLDGGGNEVAAYPVAGVLAFTSDRNTMGLIIEDVCTCFELIDTTPRESTPGQA